MIQDPDDILELARHLAGDAWSTSANTADLAEVVPGSYLGRLANSAVLVVPGSWSLLDLEHGQRLFRDAGSPLVFGSRPAIRASSSIRLLSAPE